MRSRAKLSYTGAQADLDAGRGGEQLELLRTVGTLRQQIEVQRGGVSLSVPEQEIVATDQRWELAYRAPLPVEDWNAQLSLATGMAAAALMLKAGVGILRTLPPARDGSIAKLRRTASALGISWPHAMGYPEFVRSLSASVPAHAAMLNACTMLFRGAGLPGVHRRRRPTSPCTQPSRRRTRTRPPRCGGWWTATPARPAWRSARGSRCRTGWLRRCPRCRR